MVDIKILWTEYQKPINVLLHQYTYLNSSYKSIRDLMLYCNNSRYLRKRDCRIHSTINWSRYSKTAHPLSFFSIGDLYPLSPLSSIDSPHLWTYYIYINRLAQVHHLYPLTSPFFRATNTDQLINYITIITMY